MTRCPASLRLPYAVACAAVACAFWATVGPPAGHGSPAPRGRVALAITADSAAFLQSCGCGQSPSLGLTQRATLLRRLRVQHAGLIALDAGNLGDTAWKAAAALEAMALMGYSAVALQPADEALVRTLGWPSPGERVQAVRENDPLRWVATADDGPRVAVVSGAWWRTGLAALAPQAPGAQPPDLLVCLGPPAVGAEAFAAAARAAIGPGCGILVAGTPLGQAESMPLGVASAPITAGGSTVCVVQASRGNGGAWEWRSREERVTAELEADTRVRATIDRYYLEQQEAFLAAQRDAPGAQRGEGDGVRVGTDLGYVPAWGCRNCHRAAFTKWQHTRHARAVETLARKQRLVPECLACHSEEFRRTGRLRPRADLAGQGRGAAEPLDGSIECASCHGAGLSHAALGTKGDREHRKPVRCTGCHSAERSPRFALAAYQARIRH